MHNCGNCVENNEKEIEASKGQERKPSPNTEGLLKPLLSNLTIWGFKLGKNKWGCYSIVVLIMIHLHIGFLVGKFIILISRTNARTIVSIQSFNLAFDTIQSLLTTYHFYYYNSHISQIREAMHTTDNITTDNRPVRKLILFSITFVWLDSIFKLIYCGCVYIFSDKALTKDWDFVSVFGSERAEINLPIMFLSDVTFAFFTQIPNRLLMLLYSTICKEIEIKFNSIEQLLCNSNITRTELIKVTQNYSNLCNIVSNLDAIYSPVVLMWLLKFGLYSIFYITNLRTADNGGEIFILTMGVCVILILSFVLVTFSSGVLDSSQNMSRMAYNIYISCKNEIVKDEAFRFYQKCLLDPPHFTVWKMCVINRGLILTCFSVVLTYLVVTFQLSN